MSPYSYHASEERKCHRRIGVGLIFLGAFAFLALLLTRGCVLSAGAVMPELTPLLSAAKTNTMHHVTLNWTNSFDSEAIGYHVYSGTVKGCETNLVSDTGSNTNITLTVSNNAPRTFWIVRTYNDPGLDGPPSNTAWWPPMSVVHVSGNQLQCSSVLPPIWHATNSPLSITNPTDTRFFRSTDMHGPAISKTLTCSDP